MNRRLLVDLEALNANYERFVASGNGRMGAVVKADGYGTGAVEVGRRLLTAGCGTFFVATAEEGQELREALGATPEIFVFEGALPHSVDGLVAAALTPVLNHAGQLELWRRRTRVPAAIHVDTGMSRLGFSDEVSARDLAGMELCLLMTHLACADEPAHPLNDAQISRFDAVRRRFPGVRTSIGNSAGCLTSAARTGDLGRPGIGLYGGNPFVDRDNPCRPVAALQGRVLQVKALSAGESVGYGATCVLDRATRVAVVGLGYADGVPRQLSGRGAFVLGGRARPILGRISMDLTVVDLGGDQTVVPGDWAECFGLDRDVNTVAAEAGGVAYTLLTGVGRRVPRHYGPLSGSHPAPP